MRIEGKRAQHDRTHDGEHRTESTDANANGGELQQRGPSSVKERAFGAHSGSGEAGCGVENRDAGLTGCAPRVNG